jgi:hypothetical protein
MPDVISTAPAQVKTWVALDVHKLSIVAATLPATGGTAEVVAIENTERAIRRLIGRLGGPAGLAVCYEAARAAMTCCGWWAAWASRVIW